MMSRRGSPSRWARVSLAVVGGAALCGALVAVGTGGGGVGGGGSGGGAGTQLLSVPPAFTKKEEKVLKGGKASTVDIIKQALGEETNPENGSSRPCKHEPKPRLPEWPRHNNTTQHNTTRDGHKTWTTHGISSGGFSPNYPRRKSRCRGRRPPGGCSISIPRHRRRCRISTKARR